MGRSVSRIVGVTLITAGLVLGSWQQALAAATISVTPAQGIKTSSFASTYTYQPGQLQCANNPQWTVTFYWDGPVPTANQTADPAKILGQAPLDPQTCKATKTGMKPPQGASCGTHHVYAWMDDPQTPGSQPATPDTVSSPPATYKILCPTKSPTPKPTQTKTQTPSATPTTQPTRTPTATPTPSNTPVPEASGITPPLPPALAPGSPLTPIGGGFKTGTFVPFAVGGLAVIAAAGLVGGGKLMPGITGGARTGTAVLGFAVGLGLIGVGVPVSSADKVIELDPLSLGLETRQATVTVEVGRAASAEVHCPAGKLPVSGGFNTDWDYTKTGPEAPPFGPSKRWGGPADYYNNRDVEAGHRIGPLIRESGPTADGWRIELFSSTSNLGPILATVRVLCANATTSDTPAVGSPHGITRWAKASTPSIAGTVLTPIAECPAGGVATGASHAVGNGAITDLTPFSTRADAWMVHLIGLPGESAVAQAGVVCAAGAPATGDAAAKASRGALLSRLVSGPTVRVPVSTVETAQASCPSGSKLTGGGYAVRRYLEDLAQYTIVLENGPADGVWRVRIYGARVAHTDSQLTPFAICVTQKKS